MDICNFYEWLNEQLSNVIIDDSRFRSAVKEEGEKIIDGIQLRSTKVNNFNPQQFIQRASSALADYPKLQALIMALNSNDSSKIFAQQSQLRNWLMDKSYRGMEVPREVSREISVYVDYLDKDNKNLNMSEESVWQFINGAIVDTNKNMQVLSQLIQKSISQIPSWNQSPILIEPEANYNEFNSISTEATDSALITVGNGEMSPQFSLFRDDNQGIIIDDVIEGGDEDFFTTSELQADYFSLINELRNPGSTSKGKILTLYTARPKKDREQFLQQKTLPQNVFLSNSLNHVEGLANDLSSSETRDVWKVRINSKYLTNTLDGPIKYYQITSNNAPVEYLNLI